MSSAIVAQIIVSQGSSATPIPGYASVDSVSSQVYTQVPGQVSSAFVPGSQSAASTKVPFVTAQPSVFASSAKANATAQTFTGVMGAQSTFATAGAAGMRASGVLAFVLGVGVLIQALRD